MNDIIPKDTESLNITTSKDVDPVDRGSNLSIRQEIKDCHEQFEKLDGLIAELFEQLEPILEPDEGNSGIGSEQTGIPLLDEIRHLNNSIRNGQTRIFNIKEKVRL